MKIQFQTKEESNRQKLENFLKFQAGANLWLFEIDGSDEKVSTEEQC